MTGALAAVAAICSVVAAVLLLTTSMRLRRAAADIDEAARTLRQAVVPTLNDLHDASARTADELRRVEALLERAGSVSRTADSAARLAYLAAATPVVKARGWQAGVSRATEVLRDRRAIRSGER